jgi:hypothetical protein
MTKRAIVVHAVKRAIEDFSPKISARTDFSPPSAQKTLFSARTDLTGRKLPATFRRITVTHFFHARLRNSLIVAAYIVIPTSIYVTLSMMYNQ